MKTKLSYIYILCAAALWGTMGIFVNKLTGFGFTSMQIVFWRAIVAAAVLVCYLLITDRSLLKIKLRDCPILDVYKRQVTYAQIQDKGDSGIESIGNYSGLQ